MEAIIKCKALEFELLHGKSIKSKNQKSKKQSGSESHQKLLKRFGDFPGCPVAKTPCLQCKGHKFQPWSGNQIPTCSCCSVTKSCLTLCNPMNCSMLGFLFLHYLLGIAQTSCPLIHWFHPMSSSSVTPSSSALNLSQHQDLLVACISFSVNLKK